MSGEVRRFGLRDKKWSKSIAVGTKAFIEATVKRLGIRAKGCKEEQKGRP
jgi:hypothetical protein